MLSSRDEIVQDLSEMGERVLEDKKWAKSSQDTRNAIFDGTTETN